MKITKLEVQKNDKNRVNLYVDDEFYSGIPAELVYLEHLKTGLEIDEKDLKKIIFENEKSKAMSRVTKYIGSSLKTQKQIRDYLRKKEYSDDTIEFVMSKLVEYNYIDDKKYAQAYVLTYGKIIIVNYNIFYYNSIKSFAIFINFLGSLKISFQYS